MKTEEACREVNINGADYLRKDLAGMPEALDGRIPVVVFTDYRGVFFGWMKPEDEEAENMTLTGVRNCIYWAKSIGGVFGLAAEGPNASCQIGPVAPSLHLKKVHGVAKCNGAATKAWETAPCHRG